MNTFISPIQAVFRTKERQYKSTVSEQKYNTRLHNIWKTTEKAFEAVHNICF
jgi:hypothetical protein